MNVALILSEIVHVSLDVFAHLGLSGEMESNALTTRKWAK